MPVVSKAGNQEIKRLLGSPLGQGKTRIFAIAGMIAGLAGVALGIFVIMTLYGESASIASADNAAFHSWLESLTWYTGFGMIAFGVAALFSALSKRKYMLVSLAIGLGMGILAISYINWLRNPAPWGESDFVLFQELILVIEVVAFAPFLIGFIVEIVRIAQE
jgi:hypothetical protein